MNKRSTAFIRRIWICLLAGVLLLSQPAAAALPGPEASITSARILKLAKKYDYSAYCLLKAYKKSGGSLLEWSLGRSRLTQVMDVTTHETSHAFMNGTSRATSYYIGNGKTIRVKHTKVFRSKRMAGSIPTSLRTYRYDTYVGKPISNLGSDVGGIYGLMNEFTAYCWGMHIDNAMIPYYEKYCLNFDLLEDYLLGCENNKMAYSEFRFYMLHYLYYAKKHVPDVYKGIVRNKQFCRVYKKIEKKFVNQIKAYEKELKRLPPLLKKYGYVMIVTDEHVLIYDRDAQIPMFALGRFTTEYNKLIRACAKSKYKTVEKRLTS